MPLGYRYKLVKKNQLEYISFALRLKVFLTKGYIVKYGNLEDLQM